jgi:hypothetical protein
MFGKSYQIDGIRKEASPPNPKKAHGSSSLGFGRLLHLSLVQK